MYESTNENDQYVPRNISIDIPNNPETVLHWTKHVSNPWDVKFTNGYIPHDQFYLLEVSHQSPITVPEPKKYRNIVCHDTILR